MANKPLTLSFDDPERLRALAGEHHQNLARVAERLGIEVEVRGGDVTLAGEQSAVVLAADLLEQLVGLVARGLPILRGDVDQALRLLAADRHTRLAEAFLDQVYVRTDRRTIRPKSLNQKVYVEAMRRNDLVFAIGPAGTGKTYLAMALAVSMLSERRIRRIVLTRPAVEAGEKLGFLPGTMAEKVNPYLRPLYDALHEMVDADRARELLDDGVIEVAPLAFMRGRTLNDSFIILDEAQNTTAAQMKMFLTRMGFGSRMVVTGDVTQVDLPNPSRSGMGHAARLLAGMEGVAVLHLAKEDVVRHPLVSRIVEAYDREDARREAAGRADAPPTDPAAGAPSPAPATESGTFAASAAVSAGE